MKIFGAITRYLAYIVTLPLITDGSMNLGYEYPKALTLRFLILPAFLFLVAYELTKWRKLKLSTSFKFLFGLLLLYLLVLFWSGFFGLSFSRSFWGGYSRFTGVLTYLYLTAVFIVFALSSSWMFSPESFSRVIVATSFLVSLKALLDVLSYYFLHLYPVATFDGRVVSTLGQPNFLGGFLVACLPFTVYLLSKRADRAGRALLVIIFATQIMAVFVSFSRSAYLGVIVLLALYLINRLGLRQLRRLLSLHTITIFAFFLLVLFPAFVSLRRNPDAFPHQIQRLAALSDPLRLVRESRFQVLALGLRLFSARPILGFGPENFSLAFLSSLRPSDRSLFFLTADRTHNEALDVAVSTGIFGLVIYILMIATVLTVLIRRCQKTRSFWYLSLTASFLAIVLHNQFDVVPTVFLVLFYAVAGLSVSSLYVDAEQFRVSSPEAKRYHFRFAFVVVLSLVLSYPLCISPFLADRAFKSSVDSYNRGQLLRAIEFGERATSMAPWVEEYRLKLSDYYHSQGFETQDGDYFLKDKDLLLSCKSACASGGYYFRLGQLYDFGTSGVGGNLSSAEQNYKKAIALEPVNGTFQNSYGRFLFKQRKFIEAANVLEASLPLLESISSDTFSYLAYAYCELGNKPKANEYYVKSGSSNYCN